MFGPVLEAYLKKNFVTKNNTIVSIFVYVFIGIKNYWNFFLLYSIQFYTGFLSQRKHLKIEVGGWYGWWNKKTKFFING